MGTMITILTCGLILLFCLGFESSLAASDASLCTKINTKDGISETLFLKGVMPSNDSTYTAIDGVRALDDCVKSCCESAACRYVFHVNDSCNLVECNKTSSNDCAPVSTSDPGYSGSLWLDVQKIDKTGSHELITSDEETTAGPLTSSIPDSNLDDVVCSVNRTVCGIREECIPLDDVASEYVCRCIAGYRRDSINKTCVEFDFSTTTKSTTSESLNSTRTSAQLSSLLTSPPLPEPLVVSAGEGHTIQLPIDYITLNVFVLPAPAENEKDLYSYAWSLSSQPEGDDTGHMDDIDSPSLKLTHLGIGTYTFKVTVQKKDDQKGEAFVNVTVLPPARQNTPPVAIAKPPFQKINQPNDLIIDGLGSTDDDKIVKYQWELISGPLEFKISADLDKPILSIAGPSAGDYRFRLTVTDSDGSINSTFANVTVIKEVDYSPKANAGSNVIINLPQNSVVLNGNSSTDDKGIVRYEWTKKSDDKLTADMTGSRTPYLVLANLQLGDYTFSLKVFDAAGQSDSADVHVFVGPDVNQPPVANGGPDQTVWLPVDSVILDGSNSTDDHKIVSYNWTFISGPNTIMLVNPEKPVASFAKPVVGVYSFLLTVTDEEGKESTSKPVTITVKQNPNVSPKANAGGDLVIELPVTIVTISGAMSSDDRGIVSYLWTRSTDSPAAGDVVLQSDQEAVLQLINVIPGRYTFTLQVADVEGLTATDTMTLTVKPDARQLNLVHLLLVTEVMAFTSANKVTLEDQLALLLRKGSQPGETHIVIRHLSEDFASGRTLITFYVETEENGQKTLWPGPEVESVLRKKLRSDSEILDFRAVRFNTVVCQSNCSGHGKCDQANKWCICDPFWMPNFFKAYFGPQETNCDWSILYVVIVFFLILFLLALICWAVICFCKKRFARRKPKAKRHRYMLLEEGSTDETIKKANGKLENLRARTQKSSVMQSDSECSSEETLFMNNNKSANGIIKKGASNGISPHLAVS